MLERIAAACLRSGRDPSAVTLVAVSKTVGPDRVAAAVEAGFTLFGENRVQEAAGKSDVAGARWHLIGPLQSNKARRALGLFEVIETVEGLELAQRLARFVTDAGRPPLSVLLQVNVDADPAKSGFTPDALEATLPELLALRGLRVDGLMTVGRQVATAGEARPTFVALRDLSLRLRGASPGLGAALSMGMSEDFEVAVEEGATIVRIGRAIFGERPPG